MLYLKYRSRTLDEVLGQDNIVSILKKQIESGTFGHAYLFVGIRGVGKTSIARIFAKTVNCKSLNDSEPCNTCSSCSSFDDGSMVDVIEIDAASNNGVDNVRELKQTIKSRPYVKKKVVIIDEVHMLSTSAFNALLKDLEEPPEDVIFILATTELNKVPATIRSRCQFFTFKRIGIDVIQERISFILEKEGYPPASSLALEKIARLADGSMRDALSLLESLLIDRETSLTLEHVNSCLGLIDSEVLCDVIEVILKKDLSKALGLIRQTYETGVDAFSLLAGLKDFVISMLYHITGIEKANMNQSLLERIEGLARAFTIESLTNLYANLDELNRTKELSFADIELFVLKTSTRLFGLDEQFKEDLCELTERVAHIENGSVNISFKSETEQVKPEMTYEEPSLGSEAKVPELYGVQLEEALDYPELFEFQHESSTCEEESMVEAQIKGDLVESVEETIVEEVDEGNEVVFTEDDFGFCDEDFAMFQPYAAPSVDEEDGIEDYSIQKPLESEEKNVIIDNLFELLGMFSNHDILGKMFENNVEITLGEDNEVDIFVKYPTTYHTYSRYYKEKQGPFKRFDNKVNLVMVNNFAGTSMV